MARAAWLRAMSACTSGDVVVLGVLGGQLDGAADVGGG
jgi:hypothetical protein